MIYQGICAAEFLSRPNRFIAHVRLSGADTVCHVKNTGRFRELLVPVFKEGRCVYQSPSVMEIRDICAKELDTLWDETRRFSNPHKVYIDLSRRLYDMKYVLLDSLNTFKEDAAQ